MLAAPGPGELLRAAQKDAAITEQLQRRLASLGLQLLRPAAYIRHGWAAAAAAGLGYGLATTLGGLQVSCDWLVRVT